MLAARPVLCDVAVVVAVKDDRDGLAELLTALEAQEMFPAEVVFVDGGSGDGTRELLEGWDARIAHRVLDGTGLSIAAARNLGVGQTACVWIACTDAGCRPVAGWLRAIAQECDNADFVAGSVVVDGRTPFEQVLALTTFPRADELDATSRFIRVSHRLFGRGSTVERVGGGYMAFRRDVWAAVGGFPDGLRASDDRAFGEAVAAAGYRMARVPEAEVYWRPRSSWRATAAMFFNYNRGDIRVTGRRRHGVRALAWALVLTVGLRGGGRARAGLVLGGMAYTALPFDRARRDGLAVRERWRIPALAALKDLAAMAGAICGLLDVIRTGRS